MKSAGRQTAVAIVVVAFTLAAGLPTAEGGSPQGPSAGKLVMESSPTRITIYRSGPALVEEELRLPKEGSRAIRLPPSAVISSLDVITGDGSHVPLVIHNEEVDLSTNQGPGKKITGYLIELPSAGKGRDGSVTVRYSVGDTYWEPHLKAMVIDEKTISLVLKGVIHTGVQSLHECSVTLASGPGPLGASIYYDPYQHLPKVKDQLWGSEAAYELGKLDLPAGTTVVATVLSKNASLKWRYLWDTRTRKRVKRLAVITSPFKEPLCPSEYRIFREGIAMGKGRSDWVLPGEILSLPAGFEAGIAVNRSIVTEDISAPKNPWFRHHLEFTMNNQTGGPVLVELVFGKMESGSRRTEYSFGRNPDRKPADIFVWDIRIPSGDMQVFPFSFESSRPRYREYRVYEDSDYGD